MLAHYCVQKVVFKVGICIHCVAIKNGTIFVGCGECIVPVIYCHSCILYHILNVLTNKLKCVLPFTFISVMLFKILQKISGICCAKVDAGTLP